MGDEDLVIYGDPVLAKKIWTNAERGIGVEPEDAQLYVKTLPEHGSEEDAGLLADQKAVVGDVQVPQNYLADEKQLHAVLSTLKGANAIDGHHTERVGDTWRTSVNR